MRFKGYGLTVSLWLFLATFSSSESKASLHGHAQHRSIHAADLEDHKHKHSQADRSKPWCSEMGQFEELHGIWESSHQASRALEVRNACSVLPIKCSGCMRLAT